MVTTMMTMTAMAMVMETNNSTDNKYYNNKNNKIATTINLQCDSGDDSDINCKTKGQHQGMATPSSHTATDNSTSSQQGEP